MGPSTVSVYTGAGFFSGTSAAAPHVAGCAALLRSRFPSWTHDELVAALESSTSADFGAPGKDEVYGSGTVHNDLLVPVELLTFDAVQEENSIKLLWETGSETENLGFDIYRSVNSKNDFHKINSSLIEGAGTTAEATSYEYTDDEVSGNATYYYALADVDFYGHVTWHESIEVTFNEIPHVFTLGPCYPNPFSAGNGYAIGGNRGMLVTYSLGEAAQVSIDVYDITGRRIKQLVNERKKFGEHRIRWDGTNGDGYAVASGIYIIRMCTSGRSVAQEITLIR